MEELEITDDDLRAFCLLEMPLDSAKYIALSAELLADPVNSRIARYSQEGERVMKIVENAELNWAALLAKVEVEESTNSSELRPNDGETTDGKERRSK